MRDDWIDDVLAVIDTGSFARAAALRCVTQSAFARRIDGIEARIGGPIFDRSRKPIALRPGMAALASDLRRTRQVQTALLADLAQTATGGGAPLTLACQHAIAATASPGLVRRLAAAGLEPVRVRSGNRDACLLMALSGEADLAVTYALPDAPPDTPPDTPGAFVERTIGHDRLVPLAAPGLAPDAGGAWPVVAYPPDVFLGRVIAAALDRLSPPPPLRRRAVTALTLAAWRYALDGLGAAWLPLSLAARDIGAGRLVRVSGIGPDIPLDLQLLRRSDPARAVALRAWAVAVEGPSE